MTKDELIDMYDSFVNEIGAYYQFKSFLEEKGYTESELEKVLCSIDIS